MHEYLFKKIFNLKRWQKTALCFVLGGLSALAMAPYYLVFFFLALPVFLIVLQSAATAKQSFAFGWFFGFGFFVAGLYWISYALHVDLEKFWWVVPLAVLGIPFLLSFFVALASLLTWRVSPPEYPYFPIFFAASFSLFEFLRGIMFTGFPWNLIGHTWGFYPEMMQISSVVGVYGLSLITLIAFSLAISPRGFFVGLFILSSLWLFGKERIPADQSTMNTQYNIILVQPNITQIEKWNLDLADVHMDHLINLSTQSLDPNATNVIIWPETAITYFLKSRPDLVQRIKRRLPPDSILITGGIDIEFKKDDNTPYIYNSIFIGSPKDYKAWYRYDKFHLVPFGEYIPLRQYMPVMPVGGTDFSAGPGNITYTLPNTGLSISPLVCYEGIFPGNVVNKDEERPSLLVNITNDAWYLDSIGPYQHHDSVRFRSIEEGIPLARVANTGISSMIDAYGRIVAHADLQTATAIRTNLPASLQNATLFAQYGNSLYLFLVAFFLAVPVFVRVFRIFI